MGDKKYRYTLTSITKPKRCIGFARRRIGRGGRIILDRLSNEEDDFWRTLDYTIYEKKDITTNMANKSTVNDSTNSFTNLLGNGLNHRNSNNNIRTDFKTEYSQNNSSSRTNISEVFSESVSENQCTKQETIDVQEKEQIIHHHTQEQQEEMAEFLRSVQNWYVKNSSARNFIGKIYCWNSGYFAKYFILFRFFYIENSNVLDCSNLVFQSN